jgi:LacI family transcriptional regulator
MNNSRRRPNLSQIAALLDVSAATVSNALSGRGRVSAELVDKIRATAADLGYVPGTAGRALRTGRSYVLGLVLPDIANPLFPQIAQAIEHAAAKAGYGVLIADSRSDVALQTEVINRLLERGVDGIVIVPRRGTRIADIGSPIAVIDSPSTPGNTVSADHWQGGQLVAEHLASLGHRKILIIGNNPASIVQNDRIGGIKSRLPSTIESETIWIEKLETATYTGCPLGLEEKFREGFTAFAAVSDLHALRALTELLSCGITVPEQASVTGFDDLIWSSSFRPALTTVHMDMPAIANVAIDALTSAIETIAAGEDPAGPGPVRPLKDASKCVPMTLVVRQTSASPRLINA